MVGEHVVELVIQSTIYGYVSRILMNVDDYLVETPGMMKVHLTWPAWKHDHQSKTSMIQGRVYFPS